MDMYHSRLTQDDLNELIIRYKIHRDLHHRLPSEEFVMSDLPDDAIGVYHRPLGLNKVVTFEVLCRSLQIEPTVTLAIPDYMSWRHPDSTINDLKPPAGSFNMEDVRRLSAHVVKLRDMPEGVLVLSGLSRVWKSRTCDLVLRGADGNVMGIHDFLCLPEWTGAEVQEEPHHDIRPTLQRLPFYCTPPAAVDAGVSDPTPEDLAAGNPSVKVVAKAEASQKRYASISGAISSHVAKRTSDDDDACVEIPLVTHIRSAVVIPSSRNQGEGFAAPIAEGLRAQDSLGKGIMIDAAAASSACVSRPRSSSGPASSFRDISGDVIHRDVFPFSPGPYYATYLEGGVVWNCEFSHEEWDAPHQPTLTILTKKVFKDPSVGKTMVNQFPTPGEMVRIEALSSDQLTTKMSVLHCLMMSHGGELLARYRGLLQSYHEYVQSTDSRLKGYQEKFASLTGLKSQVPGLQRQIAGLNDKLSSFDAAFSKSKAKGKERKKKIKSLTKTLDQLNVDVVRLSTALNQATILEAEKDEEILWLKASPPEFVSFFRGQFQGLVRKFLASDEFSRVQGELLSLAASVGFERGLSMHRTREE
ncbi:hypothetical protein Tco_0789841 [Tanacetum coccineum]